jgi:hypothetical protein
MGITRSALLACFIFFVGYSATAQDYPKYEFFGGYSYARMGGANWNGWLIQGARNLSPNLGIVLDASGPHNSISQEGNGVIFEQTQKAYAFMIGPQAAAHGPYKLTPFAHLLLGAAHVSYHYSETVDGASYSGDDNDTEFAMALGGGIDFKWRGPISFRGQMDYMGFRVAGGSLSTAYWNKGIRLSIGIAIRLGNIQ